MRIILAPARKRTFSFAVDLTTGDGLTFSVAGGEAVSLTLRQY